MKHIFFAAIFLAPMLANARPLFLEPAGTTGRLAFESIVEVSQRWDNYGSPQSKYTSVSFPITLRLGLSRRLDVGATLQHVSQRLKTGAAEFSGSDAGRLSPQVKFGFRDNISVLGIWHVGTNEEDQELPIARGDSPEIRFLAAVPTALPLAVDIGYLRQARYNGRLGVQGVPLKNIDPGDIFDARVALLFPLSKGFSASLETVYSTIGDQEIEGVIVADTSGEALDVFLGLTWSYKDLVLGLGGGTSLLDESHTSFAIDRGAGDFTAKFLFSYKLQPKKIEP